MYKGRHCILLDYQFLEEVTRDFLREINRDNFDIEDIENYLHTFSDFDFDIASKIRFNLKKSIVNKDKIIDLINELKSNVLVDIREHN